MSDDRCEHDMQVGDCGDCASPVPLRWASRDPLARVAADLDRVIAPIYAAIYGDDQ